ncbi:tetratricopeptide repeat protein [Sphingomonas sp. RB56-2]|uniref:Tetratricopeptide repeat protein n=1 Tax=Sphingomonas brevis TaxID=2908206 RepID=A0ABT0S7I6_9SPHN|nr:SPOR domain-containing protein [Sphingomonas brevis]MCL6740359.1 tetratricopeptide repeat protein [Sphingomonas brevis]
MTKSNRLATTLTAVSLLAIVTACAGPTAGPKSASIFGGKVDTSNIGIATKAQMALATNDVATAISLAERAVENSPRDAGFRALLGNCYLAAGRFASAEAAFKDSLTLVAQQPQIILKLALVEIAQGKNDEAKYLLAQAQGVLDVADVGLALALAGDPQNAIAVLDPAARAVGADSRTRQNLALAHALAGNWEQAKIVAGQDVPGDQLDARIQQWMALAKPARASDQVAAFIGIQPVASDPGQPVRLALNQVENVRQAAAEPIGDVPQGLTSTATVELPPAPEPQAEPVVLASAEPAPVADVVPAAMIEPTPAPVAAAMPAPAISEARPALSPAAVRLSDPVPSLRKASAPRLAKGKSRAVVQIGAYSSRDRINAAWSKATGKHASLKRFVPVTARFTASSGTFYRLAVKGFDSDREAVSLCNSLKRAGASCFVRTTSGDAPVQFASR